MQDRYDTSQTWRWNLEHAPDLSPPAAVSPFPGSWNWCGIPVNSPLGVAAGPLLNGRWLVHYARRGFDVLVYKTVRTTPRDCYPLPNLVPVDVAELNDAGTSVPAQAAMKNSWAVSFGVPSVPVAQWQDDIRWTKRQLDAGQVLVVSVVGTEIANSANRGTLDELANDFARCAQLACEAGADGIEANFSCPNVATADGQLFQNPDDAGRVARRIRDAIDRPLVLKIGFTDSTDLATELVTAVAPFANGLAMTNSISAHVVSTDGSAMFNGQQRGICGDAIRDASVRQVRMFSDVINELNVAMQIIGVGGISSFAHVEQYLDAGASTVALATAVMVDPDIGLTIRKSASRQP